MNAKRAKWAGAAIAEFAAVTGCEEEDSLGDLLADLMHWADRNNYDFDAALFRGHGHYLAETGRDVSRLPWPRREREGLSLCAHMAEALTTIAAGNTDPDRMVAVASSALAKIKQ